MKQLAYITVLIVAKRTSEIPHTMYQGIGTTSRAVDLRICSKFAEGTVLDVKSFCRVGRSAWRSKGCTRAWGSLLLCSTALMRCKSWIGAAAAWQHRSIPRPAKCGECKLGRVIAVFLYSVWRIRYTATLGDAGLSYVLATGTHSGMQLFPLCVWNQQTAVRRAKRCFDHGLCNTRFAFFKEEVNVHQTIRSSSGN